MSVMAADTPAHARRTTPGKSRADVWFVLILTGGTSAFLQMWHATHSGGTGMLIAAPVGLVPAATAIGLSHVVASHKGVMMLRLVTFAVMIAAMIVSIGAVAAVVRPIEGRYFSWVFGLALDAAALACVWVLLGDSERRAAEASALRTAEREAGEARESAREATGKAARLEAELATVSASLEAERARRVPGRKPRRGSGRRPAGTGTRNRVPAATGSSAPEDAPDIDTEARILGLIAEGHSASAAGVMAGKSDSYGRQVARLARAAKREPAGDRRSDGDMDTGEQPRVS